jgi:hypothetical protein
MTYHRTPPSHALSGVSDVFNAAAAIVEDPCLGPVASLVLRLHAAQQPRVAVAPGQPTPPPARPVKGVGLCYAVKPLQGLVWVRERPWVVPLGAAALVGGLVGLGYLAGRGAR